MVRLTIDFIKKISTKPYSSPEKTEDSLKKITHLNLSERLIDSIGDISSVKNLTVLYLHHNNLQGIESLNKNRSLTHLYLHHNKISKIENLNNLNNLKKLYLGYNCISVVEGLEDLTSLEELHIESQKLQPGETIYFDPRSIKNLSNSLRVLDISHNNVSSINDLKELKMIEKLNASSNGVYELQTVCRTVSHWPKIKELDFQGNEIVHHPKYRDKIIASTNSLKTLDNKDITDITRSFIHRFEHVKEERTKRMLKASQEQTPFSDDIASIAEHLPPGLRQTVSASVKREALPRAKSLTLSLMQVPFSSSTNCVALDDGVVACGGLQPRPSRRVSYAEHQTRSRLKAEKEGQSSLPQLAHDLPLNTAHSP